ncbi:MAG: extracellular solute-binding protein [Sphaerochaetaceae bacterium]|jgi:spermidine/putrescine transport system substrate-binding protein
MRKTEQVSWRRAMHLVVAIVVMSMVLVGVSSCKKQGANGTSSDNKLYLYNWTYYTPDEIIERFEKEYDVDVVVDNFSSNEEMFAKLMAGGGKGYDIIFPSADYTSIMINLGLVEELDHDKLPNLKYISPLVRSKATYDPDMRYSVPYNMGASGVAVNKTKAPEGYARDWSIFEDSRFAKRMSMLDDMREVMGAALKHLGYSVNTVNPEELAQAKALINDKWKPNLVKFDAEGFGKAFSRGEFWVVHGYAENVFEEFPEDKWDEIDFFLPPEGGALSIDNMVVVKGSQHSDMAHEFINFIHRPEIYAIFLDTFRYPAITNTEAGKYTKNKPFYSAEDVNDNFEVLQDLKDDLQLYNDIWQDIRYVN